MDLFQEIPDTPKNGDCTASAISKTNRAVKFFNPNGDPVCVVVISP